MPPMPRSTDIRTIGSALFFLPIQTRVPLKFGAETLTQVNCARVRITIIDSHGRKADGWGETPLSVQWVWPSPLPYQEREAALKQFCIELNDLWGSLQTPGHPLELGQDFQEMVLPGMLKGFNQIRRRGKEPMPWLAALVCCSAFDLALYDAFANANERPVFAAFERDLMAHDLSGYLGAKFAGLYPSDFLVEPPTLLPAWHLVGGKDAVRRDELVGDEPNDGYPFQLEDWIQRDGLKCLKIKLRGNDAAWDYARLVEVGRLAIASDV